MSAESAPASSDAQDASSHSTAPARKHHSNLEDLENEHNPRFPFILSYTEVKLLGIAGVGFFLDAYDLFIINPVATMLQYRLYGGHSLPPGLEGFIKAGANIGSVIGQFAFGYSADYFGRKAVYGKELMLIIFATIGIICDPTGAISANGALIWLGVWRIILGIGVGGDYPMSASVATDRANVKRRGTLLAYIFANQGWGSFVGSLAFIIILLCYKPTMDAGAARAWRILVGLSLIPAFGTLYQRLTLPESTRPREEERSDDRKACRFTDVRDDPTCDGGHREEAPPQEFFAYFSEWRHLKILIGTCTCWFLLDIAFYGINLNQNVVLQQIGFDGSSGTPWERLFKIGVGSLIITALGFVPGYYVSVLTIEYLGRKWIQIQGFLLAALFLGILAGQFHELSTPAFIVCFAFLQFFFNFGANTTTYCYPAEVFPTKFRASAHGMSAACGKAGAILSALAFNSLSKQIGTPAVLWIFFGCCIAGAGFTLLLPEVRGRDPDLVYEEELRERRALRHD
ncbi:MFS general substrate transporter [Epithele typhae]|uniref:MFS general substrate transporter n=1 Tax=Epithele typhae TaxID=378194 RepID=UPI002008B47F|nr:MFS general substrate transporter [Epithele typhae]KAH9942537.1 MFS general substrate transporter [Epithele typhae]